MDIKQNLTEVWDRIDAAARRSGRSAGDIQLVAVSKTIPEERVSEAIAAGVTALGENYVQEAREKIENIGRSVVKWHFIGHLQKNKAKYVVNLFDMVHSVDSAALAGELNRRAGNNGVVLPVLAQVNISGEESKSGTDLETIQELVTSISGMKNLEMQGLMTMPPFLPPEEARPYFIELRKLRDRLADELKLNLPQLSMGMSGDFEVAIEEGATIIRVGTAIFGHRN